MFSLKMASKSRNMSLSILNKKINKFMFDYILLLHLTSYILEGTLDSDKPLCSKKYFI